MIKNHKIIMGIIVLAFMLLTFSTCGCTTSSSSVIGTDNTRGPSSDSVKGQIIQTQPEQTDNTAVSVSWRDFYSEYTGQERSELIEEAKERVMQVLPNVDRASLNGRWQEWRFKGYGDPNYGPPTIIFDNADDTSKKYEENYGKPNIITIEVDPVTMDVIGYSPAGYSPPGGFMNLDKLSFDEGIEKAQAFIESNKGEQFLEDNSDTLIVEKSDMYDDYIAGIVPLTIKSTYKGIPYYYNGIFIQYDAFSDKVNYYGDDYTDRELLYALTTLAPEPDISLEEAKQILVDKLRERYPEDDLQISYDTAYMRFEDSLVWKDDPPEIYNDDPEPIPLAWHLTFNDKYMREENPENRRFAFVDAHTGEVISGYKYRDPR